MDYFRNYGDAIDKVTVPMVEAFVKQYLLNRHYVAGVLAPAAQVDKMRTAVAATLGRRTP